MCRSRCTSRPDNLGVCGDKPAPSLPSWSRCGWQCTVDPKSLIPGLETYEESYGEGWKIRNLVQWSVMSADISEEELIREPRMLDRFKTAYAKDGPGIIANGWIRSADGDHAQAPFTHPLDPCRRHYKIPIPMSMELLDKAAHNLWSYLSCVTTSATFTINAAYTPSRADGLIAPLTVVKPSVFSLPSMPADVSTDDICHVVSLVNPEGDYAGAIRLMDASKVHFGQELELIAISTGPVEAQHLTRQCEELVLLHTNSKSSDGQMPLSLAAESGHEAVVQQLLATGKVEADSSDDFGRTPLSLAAERGHEAVVKLLQLHGAQLSQ